MSFSSREIVAAWKQGWRTVEIDGRTYDLSVHRVSNVDYLSVSPRDGFAPCANLIVDEEEFQREQERRSTPVEERSKKGYKRK